MLKTELGAMKAGNNKRSLTRQAGLKVMRAEDNEQSISNDKMG